MWGGYKDAAGQLGFDFNGKRTQELPREVPKLFDTFGAVVQVRCELPWVSGRLLLAHDHSFCADCQRIQSHLGFDGEGQSLSLG